METVLTVSRRTNLTTKGQLHHVKHSTHESGYISFGNAIEWTNAEPQEFELFVKRYGFEWRDEENR
jgi:hypothetical protein